MQLYPAIDLKDGKCVRLKQGEFDNMTVYSDEPYAILRRTVRRSFIWLILTEHLKDIRLMKRPSKK